MSTFRRQFKKLLLTADAMGGVWQYSVDLVRELSAAGCEVLVAALGPAPDEQQRRAIETISNAHLAAASFALEWMNDPWDGVARSGEWLLGLEKNFKPDVVHLNGYALAAAGWSAPAVVVAHSCVASWWQAVHGNSPGPEWNEYGRQVRRGLRAAAAIVAPSQFMADSIAAHYEIARESITLIPNFSAAPVPASRPKEQFAFAAGRIWDKAKNLVLLRTIAPELTWPLLLAGDGDGGGDGICYLGRLPHNEVVGEMARASVFAHPALYEPFGLAVLEAARARCCLVLSDIPSLRELWDGAAVFLEPRDEQSWKKTLNALAKDDVERESLGQRAFVRAQRYTAEHSVPLYLSLYERVLAGKESNSGAAA